jgi:hypothetical protein
MPVGTGSGRNLEKMRGKSGLKPKGEGKKVILVSRDHLSGGIME